MSSAAAARSKVVLPATSKHTHTLVFLHGLGDSADGGWSEVMPEFQARLPGLKVVLPNAPMSAVTLNGGMKMPSWHDIKSLQNIDQEEFKGLPESQQIVEGLLNDEMQGGVPSENLILGGFSQGGALSLFTGLQFKHRLAGILSLSAYLPHAKGQFSQLISDENKQTPILMAHGDVDQVVRYSVGQRSYQAVKEARGGDQHLEFKTYRGVGHHSSEEEMRDVADWLAKIVAAAKK